jgi:hypothetical protein
LQIYDRKIRVVIGQDDGTALSIENFFIEIEVKKGISGKPNEGFASIYNLGKSTQAQIKEKGERIRIFGGYGSNIALLNDGDIRRVDRGGLVDSITTVILGGNLVKLSQAIFDRSYSGQVSVKQIVQDAVPTFGIDPVGINQIPEAFLYDYSFSGKTSDLLDAILNPIDVQWFEDDNFIKFSTKGQAEESVVLLNKDTGLIGSPIVTDKGVKFKSALNGRITMNNRVRIESIDVTGVFKVSQVMHKGNNREGKFETHGVGVELEQ